VTQGASFPLLRFVVPAVLIGMVGCGSRTDSSAPNASDTADAPVARSQVERGPLTLTVEVQPKHARLSDEPTLTLTLDYAAGLTVHKPPFGEALGDFLIRDFREPLPKTKGDREIVRQIYTLEPTRSGTLIVEPIGVTFVDTRPDGDGKEHTVATEAVEIDVTTVQASEAPSLDDLRPAAGPIELTPARTGWAWWLGLGALVIAVAGFFLWRRMRRRPEAEQPVLSPREMAYLELQQLLEDPLAADDVKLFYVELTAIVRRYIERTTGVRAPKQTTEEFLHTISRQHTFARTERQQLKDFLESSDLVKFAAQHPNKEVVEASFQLAKVFIGLERKEAAA